MHNLHLRKPQLALPPRRNLIQRRHRQLRFGQKETDICLNAKGYAPHQEDVSPFFEEGLMGGNFDCVWGDCTRDCYFPVTTDGNCHGSGGR